MRLKNQWRVIPNHPNYEISIAGVVRRTTDCNRCRKGYILKQSCINSGYLKVSINRKNFTVHRLVLEAFVGPRPYGKECNHKNSIKSDNYLYNLEWVTHTENMEHACDTGLIDGKGENNAANKLRGEEVLYIRELLKSSTLNQTQIGKMFNVGQGAISDINIRKTWSHI